MSFVNVNNTFLATSNLLFFNTVPSKEINVSLPQSKNQGYPAIRVSRFFLDSIKLSVAIIYFFIKSSSPDKSDLSINCLILFFSF